MNSCEELLDIIVSETYHCSSSASDRSSGCLHLERCHKTNFFHVLISSVLKAIVSQYVNLSLLDLSLKLLMEKLQRYHLLGDR